MSLKKYNGPWKSNKKSLDLITPEKVDGRLPWSARKEHIMALLDKYKRLLDNQPRHRISDNNLYTPWLEGKSMQLSGRDFDRLIKMGLVKRERSMNRSWYVRATLKEEEPVQEPREPYKKRKLAIAELEQSIMTKRKGKKHERVPQSNNTTGVAG